MKILFTLSDLLHKDLVAECERLRINKSEYIRKALRNELYGTTVAPDETVVQKKDATRLPSGVTVVPKSEVYSEKTPYSSMHPYQEKDLGVPMEKIAEKPVKTATGVVINTPEEAIKQVSAQMSGEKLCPHGFGFGLCKFGCKE